MGVATELLRHLIDNEWVNQSIFNQHPTREKKNLDAFNFFNSEETGFVWQNRIFFLAERIYNLRKVENFELIRNDILNGELVSRFAEIEIGAHLMRRGIKFKFIEPSGEKTQDFDLKLIGKTEINCEIKHKIESTKVSINTIKNTLSKANKQLPKSKPGIIFLKIPFDWIKDRDFKKMLFSVITPFFKRNKNHIIGIGIRWEEQDSNFENIFYLMYKIEKNEHYSGNNEINKILNQMELPSNQKYWVSLERIILQHILNNKTTGNIGYQQIAGIPVKSDILDIK